MQEILNEKFPKYRNTWKTVELDYLLYKLRNKLIPLSLEMPLKAKRELVHIANYCYFLYSRLGDIK